MVDVTLAALADQLAVDPADLDVLAGWAGDDDPEVLRGLLDPHRERVDVAAACPGCGRWPGRQRFISGWHPCACGGHQYTWCRPDTDGCDHVAYDPIIDPEQGCREPGIGFSAP